MKELKILALIFMFSAFSFPQSINITFQVDMRVQAFEGRFILGTSIVAVCGDFQSHAGDPGGNWQGNVFQLSDSDEDTIYTGTFLIPQSQAGTTYNFNFVITTPDQNQIWETLPARQFILNPPSVVNPIVYFNNDSIYTILQEVTNTINFTADISGILGIGLGGSFDPNQDSLLVMGLDWDNLGKNVTGNRAMINTDPFNTGIYTTTLAVSSDLGTPNGIGDSTKWKFKAYPDERFQNTGWELGVDRWHIYEADSSILTLPAIVPQIQPKFSLTTIPIELIINVDMFGAVNRYNGLTIPLSTLEFVGMRGDADFLGSWNTGGCWCISDTLFGYMKVLTKATSSLWSYHTILPVGTSTGPYKYNFAAMYPGADTIHGGIYSLNNEGGFGFSHVFILSPSDSVLLINNWFGLALPPGGVEIISNDIPTSYQLEQNYPNPFNPSTKIRYSIPENSFITLKVFNLLGEEIETLVNSEQSAGVYEATFDASKLSSGIYFYTLQTKNFNLTKKMILIR